MEYFKSSSNPGEISIVAKKYVIKCNWNPYFCFFEKRESRREINELKHDIFERAMTFEGKEYHSRSGPVRGYLLPNKIDKIIATIAQHICNISLEKFQISRMVLNIKIDSKEKVWILGCTDLEFKNLLSNNPLEDKARQKAKVHTVREALPSNMNHKLFSHSKPVNLEKITNCTNCNMLLDKQSILKISLKLVIKGFEYDHYLAFANQKAEAKSATISKLKKMKSIQTPRNTISNLDLRKKLSFAQMADSSPISPLNKMKKQASSDKNQEETAQGSNLKSESGVNAYHIKESGKKIENKEIGIPPIIRKNYPKLKEREYTHLKENPIFLQKMVIICESCYLLITRSCEEGGSEEMEYDKVRNGGNEEFGKNPLNTKLIFKSIKQKLERDKQKKEEDIKPESREKQGSNKQISQLNFKAYLESKLMKISKPDERDGRITQVSSNGFQNKPLSRYPEVGRKYMFFAASPKKHDSSPNYLSSSLSRTKSSNSQRIHQLDSLDIISALYTSRTHGWISEKEGSKTERTNYGRDLFASNEEELPDNLVKHPKSMFIKKMTNLLTEAKH